MGVRYDAIIVHYSEIFLKGTVIKKRFEQVLLERLREKLNRLGINRSHISIRDHSLWIQCEISPEICKELANTFGVRYVLPVLFCKASLNDIRETARGLKELLSDQKIPSSYRVKSKKDRELSISGKTIEFEISQIFDHWTLNLSHPSSCIYAVIKKKYAYLGYQRFEGPGGLPYGVSGKVLALVSKGIDSTVAAWMMAKRGCEISLLHFGDDDIDKIKSLLESYSGKNIMVYQVSHDSFLSTLEEKKASKYLCLLCKCGMYQAAEYFAVKCKAQAIVTGENLGQVASQTLENIVAMSATIKTPVLRPLLAFDKETIINIAKEIGSYGLYQNPSCAYVPKHPSTQIHIEKLSHILCAENFISSLNDWKTHWVQV